jgi:hypothetical protein
LFVPYGTVIYPKWVFLCHYIIGIKMKKFAKKYTFFLGKNTIIGAKGANILVVSQGQGWSNINTWLQFIGTVHEIDTLHHKK